MLKLLTIMPKLQFMDEGDLMRVNTTDIQNAFGKYLSLAEKEDIIITKNGKNVAKLIRYNEPDYFPVIHKKVKIWLRN